MIYVCYATANEKRLFLEDIANLSRLAMLPSGAEAVSLLIAVSEAKPRGLTDNFFVSRIARLFSRHSRILLQEIFFKGNAGRDFSSYAMMLRKVIATASDDDHVLFLNRSARGPCLADWLAGFVNQYQKFERVGACGSTINLAGHPRRGGTALQPHIQSYSLFARVRDLRMFADEFPAERERERDRIIDDGEIGLSTAILEAGLGITSLEWPDVVLRKGEPVPAGLPARDCKTRVTRPHAFYHRRYVEKHGLKNFAFENARHYWRYLFA